MKNKSKYTGAIAVGVLLALALFGIIEANTQKRKRVEYRGDAVERLSEIKGDIRGGELKKKQERRQ